MGGFFIAFSRSNAHIKYKQNMGQASDFSLKIR